MIICLCRNVSSADIENAVSKGITSTDVFKRITRAGLECGSCNIDINEQFEKEIEKKKDKTSTWSEHDFDDNEVIY